MPKNNEPRYKVAKILIENHQIKVFSEIFSHIPKTVIAKELHTNNTRFTHLIADPFDLRLRDLDKIANLLNVKLTELISLVFEQYKRASQDPKIVSVKPRK